MRKLLRMYVRMTDSGAGLLERMLLSIVTRMPGRGTAAIVLLLYPGAGLALPLLLRWRVEYLIEANAMGALGALMVLASWFTLQLQARDRRHLVEWTTDLRLLSAEEFEWFVGEVFRREGWKVTETGRQDGPDGNIDLELMRDGQRMIAQCKRWVPRLVGVDEIRKFAGTLLREGLDGKAGTFVTLSGFTPQAVTEAEKMGLTLLDNTDLHTRVEKVRRVEPCPICNSPMILDRSPRGWWLRCVTNGCTGKRDLGNEPGRAVELLTGDSGDTG